MAIGDEISEERIEPPRLLWNERFHWLRAPKDFGGDDVIAEWFGSNKPDTFSHWSFIRGRERVPPDDPQLRDWKYLGPVEPYRSNVVPLAIDK